MTKAVQPSQYLHTSANYVDAFKNVERIEKAIGLVEQGHVVANLPQYITEFTALVKKAIQTNDLGRNANPNMSTAQKKLTKKLQDLEKRVTAVSTKAAITPPSKELIQALKVVDKPITEEKSKWPLSRIAKYTAAGIATVIASPQILSLIQKAPGVAATVANAAPGAFSGVAHTSVQVVGAATGATETAGNLINTIQSLVGLPASNSTSALKVGASYLLEHSTTQFLYNLFGIRSLMNLIIKGGGDIVSTALGAAVLCEHTLPGCKDVVENGFKATYNTIGETSNKYPVAFPLGTAALLSLGTHYSALIGRAFTGTSSLLAPGVGYGAAILLLRSALENAAPGLTRNMTKLITSHPKTSVATPIFAASGAAATSYIPWIAAKATAAAVAAVNAIALPAVVAAGQPGHAEYLVAHGVAIEQQNAAAAAARTGVVSKWRVPVTLLSATLPAIGSALTESYNNPNGYIGSPLTAVADSFRNEEGYGNRAVSFAAIDHPLISVSSVVAGLGRGLFALAFGATKLRSFGSGVGAAGIVATAGAAINAAVESYENPNGYIGSSLTAVADSFRKPEGSGSRAISFAVIDHPLISVSSVVAGLGRGLFALAFGATKLRSFGSGVGAAGVVATAGAAINAAVESYENPKGFIGSSLTAVADSFRKPEGSGSRAISFIGEQASNLKKSTVSDHPLMSGASATAFFSVPIINKMRVERATNGKVLLYSGVAASIPAVVGAGVNAAVESYNNPDGHLNFSKKMIDNTRQWINEKPTALVNTMGGFGLVAGLWAKSLPFVSRMARSAGEKKLEKATQRLQARHAGRVFSEVKQNQYKVAGQRNVIIMATVTAAVAAFVLPAAGAALLVGVPATAELIRRGFSTYSESISSSYNSWTKNKKVK